MTALPSPESLPEVLVFSEGLLAMSHGTGGIFARNFAHYPREKLENWFIGPTDTPLIPRLVDLNAARWPRGNFSPPTVLAAKVWNRLAPRLGGTRQWLLPVNRAAVTAAARAHATTARLVYAIVYSREGLDVLHAVLQGLGSRLPVILQLQDFFPSSHLGFAAALRRLRLWLAAVWAVSPQIARVAGATLGLPVHVDPPFNLDLPAGYKRTHRPFTADFRVLVLGNFWQPALLGDLRAAWKICQQRLPGLPAVRWHCHPTGIARVAAAGFTAEPEVTPAPFLKDSALFSMLAEADLAIIPFSRHAGPVTDYERFSMPSRITELAAAGLPICGLTGRDTPLSDYLAARDIGRCAPAADPAAAATLLETMIRDRDLRARLGRNARDLAEREFPLARQQDWINAEFRRLAGPMPCN